MIASIPSWLCGLDGITDGRLRAAALARLAVVKGAKSEEASDCFSRDAQFDHAAGRVDLSDRVRGNEPPLAREPPAPDGERVGNVGKRAVHRALHTADHATEIVCDDETGRAREIGGECAHSRNLFAKCKESSFRG